MLAAIQRFFWRFALSVRHRMPPWLAARARRWRRSRSSSLTHNGCVYLAVFLTVLVGSWLRDSNGLLILAGMLVGPLIVSFLLPRRTLARLQIQRRIPEWVTAGDQLVVELVVTNRRRRVSALAIDLHDACRYAGPLVGVAAVGSQVLLPHLDPRGSCRLIYEGRLPVRGRYEFGPLRISTVAPLGLVRHRRTIDLPGEVIAWPRLGRLTPTGLQLARHSDLAVQRTRRRQTRMEVDFHGLRDWRPGDSRRWIHWRSTARRGQIVVRQFDTARGHDVALFVDLFQPAADSSGGGDPAWAEKIEAALSMTATLVWDVCRQGGCRLLLVVAGDEGIFLEGRASAGLARQVLARLAVARARSSAALPVEFTDALAAVSPLSTILLVATREVDLSQLAADPAHPVAQNTRSRIRAITVGTPEMAHYFSPPPA
jgi:uncharacterized protein (DUF58 family)